MIKNEYQEITRTIVERKVIGSKMYCDICGKEILPRDFCYEAEIESTDLPTTPTSYDICSKECLRKKMEDFIEMAENSDEYSLYSKDILITRKIAAS